jgi:hypothetical protein
MKTNRQSLWRLFVALGMGALLWGGLLATGACGFGFYNDSSDPQAVSANDGVWDSGQWWPWACQLPDHTLTNPSPQSTPINYSATGSCGAGGAVAVSVDGCVMFGNWDALGLSDVSTTIPSSIPQAGGWELESDAGIIGDAGVLWICDATATDSSGDLTFTCTANSADPDVGTTTACTSTLSVVK